MQNQRQYKGLYHADQKVDRNPLIVLTDRKIDHGVKDKGQRDIGTESGKDIEDFHSPYKMFPKTERDTKETAQCHIHHKPQVITGQNILIALLIDDILHIFGQDRIKRRYRQQGKDKGIQHSTGKKFSVQIAHIIKAQYISHQNNIADYDKHRCYCDS